MPVSGFEWSEGATKTREPQTLQPCRQWLGVKYSPFSLSQRLSHSHRALQPNLILAEFQPAGKAAKGRLGTSLGLFWAGSKHLPSAQGVLWLPSGNPRQVKEMVQLWDEEAAAQMESFPTKKKKKNLWLEMCLKGQETLNQSSTSSELTEGHHQTVETFSVNHPTFFLNFFSFHKVSKPVRIRPLDSKNTSFINSYESFVSWSDLSAAEE